MGKINKDCIYYVEDISVYNSKCRYSNTYLYGDVSCDNCWEYTVLVDPIVSKPPIGLKPRCIVDTERCTEILEAMLRSTKEGLELPKIWLDELNEKLPVK